MSIDELLAALNTAAMVLGYIVLTLLLAGFFWLVSVKHEAWRYKRYRQRKHDLEWDELRAMWRHNVNYGVRTDTVEQPLANPDRVNTDVLDFTPEDIINYQGDQSHGAS